MLNSAQALLRAWMPQDIEVLQRMRNDVALQSMLMTQPRPNSRQEVLDWLARKSGARDGVFFVIANPTSSEAVGYIQVASIDEQNGTCEVGICLSPEHQCKGYGTAAMEAVFSYLPTVFNLRKLVLYVLADNQAAIRLYVKLGLREVGRLKAHFFRGGKHEDVLIMERFFAS